MHSLGPVWLAFSRSILPTTSFPKDLKYSVSIVSPRGDTIKTQIIIFYKRVVVENAAKVYNQTGP